MSCQKKSWELRIPLLPIQLVTCFLDVYFNSCMLRHVAPCYPDCLRSEVASGTRACGARCSVASWRWDERLKIFGHQIPWGLCLPIFLIYEGILRCRRLKLIVNIICAKIHITPRLEWIEQGDIKWSFLHIVVPILRVRVTSYGISGDWASTGSMGWIVVRYLGVLETYVTKHLWLCNCESSTRFWSFQNIWFREIFDCYKKMLPFRCSACTVLKKEAIGSVKHKWLQEECFQHVMYVAECWPYSTHLRSWRPHPLKNSCQASPVRTEGWSNRPVTEASWISRIHGLINEVIDNGKTAAYQRPTGQPTLHLLWIWTNWTNQFFVKKTKFGVFLHFESCRQGSVIGGLGIELGSLGFVQIFW